MPSTDLVQFLTAHTTTKAATAILDYLGRYKPTRDKSSALRATQIRPISNSYKPWPVLSWKEGDDIDVLAIFKINEEGPCSCLMHYGQERCWGTDGRRWTTSYTAWSVNSIDHIQELFVAAAHLAEVVTPAEFLFHEESGSPSTELYTQSLQ
jgi:hypothetical protein